MAERNHNDKAKEEHPHGAGHHHHGHEALPADAGSPPASHHLESTARAEPHPDAPRGNAWKYLASVLVPLMAIGQATFTMGATVTEELARPGDDDEEETSQPLTPIPFPEECWRTHPDGSSMHPESLDAVHGYLAYELAQQGHDIETVPQATTHDLAALVVESTTHAELMSILERIKANAPDASSNELAQQVVARIDSQLGTSQAEAAPGESVHPPS